tara:strand:- start:1593 stop:1865 length:273 start_codon:yes stop_codon:yes gene_type:complete
MCIFGGGGSTPAFEPLQTYKPPEPRVVQGGNPIQKGKKLSDEVGEVQEIAYGGEQTKSNPAAGKKKGASQLKIALNQPSAGAGSGGISNV